MVVRDVVKLNKGFTKQDHVIVGGPGKSLDMDYHYSTEKDVTLNTGRTTYINVGTVNVFKRHD
jgi:hypothetical protein